MKKKALWLATLPVLILFLFTVPTFAQSAALHVILVGDTVDPNIGNGDKLDLDLMKALVTDASRNTGMRLNLKVFDDSIVRSSIMSAIHSLNPGNNDTVIFFYTGHGYRMNSMRTKWPAMALKEGGRTAGLDQKWVYDTLKAKNPRLLIVMSDACNNVVADGAIDTKISLRSGQELKESYTKLFMKDSGSILASSSIPGQYSYSGNTGSQFTVSFINTIRSALSTNNPSWDSVMRKASVPLYGGRQQPQYDISGASSSGDSSIDDKNPGTDDNSNADGGDSSGGDSEYPAIEEDTELGFANLLVEMETNVLYSAQSPQWPNLRNRWIQTAMSQSSNLSQMKNALIDFEKHMKSQAMSPGWAGQKNVWANSIRSASSVSQLSRPLAAVEKVIAQSAWGCGWSAKQSQWREKVARLESSAGPIAPGDDSSPGDSSSGGGGGFAGLLIELNGSMLASAMSPDWGGKRSSWLADVKSAGNDVLRLRNSLIAFESEVLYDAQESYWPGRRDGWMTRVRAAASLSSLADLLIEAESSIKYSAQNTSWRERRPGWLNEAKSQ